VTRYLKEGFCDGGGCCGVENYVDALSNLSGYVSCIARSHETESVRRRNFGEGSEKERWERHERHVKMA